tara:strand:- start:185 stop:790 length:606 start_codon:yes stop_codon:yes gene_type:complete
MPSYGLREFPNVLTKEECDLIIKYSKPLLKRCEVIDEDSKKGNELAEERTSSQTCLTFRNKKTKIGKVLHKIKEIISYVTELPIENQETPIGLYYGVGQEYQPHYDDFAEGSKYLKNEQKFGGQRLSSILIYLNDVEEGGETWYPNLNLQVKPETGKLLYHTNYSNGKRLESGLHGSKPVIKGEKWALVCWIRERKWTPGD